MAEITHNSQDEPTNVRSEEVQTIIDRMPTRWSKWIVLLVGVLMGIVLLMSFLIKYPDTVDGQITITARMAPVRLVANVSGKMNLVQPNKARLSAGDVIGYIESGASYQDVLLLDSLLRCITPKTVSEINFPEHLILGNISAAYNSFVLSCMQYIRLEASDIYENMRDNLKQQVVSDKNVVSNVEAELAIKEDIADRTKEQLYKDSILWKMNGLSEQDYKERYNNYLSVKGSLVSLKNNKLVKLSEINRNQLEIQRIILEEVENKEEALSELIAKKNELTSAVNLWKEQYLQYAPIAGELEYLGFWRDNVFVQSGTELFSVIPHRNEVVGEVVIPAYGSGKVETGQAVNVKVNNYPYDEYGLIEGKVHSISRITNKTQDDKGITDSYLVIVDFPDGTNTNYDIELPLDFETKGIAEIIIKPKRLIERLFDNLKSKTVK